MEKVQTTFEIAIYVGMAAGCQETKVAAAKAGQVKGDNMGVLITAAVMIVFLLLIITAVIFVCLVWAHRTDLSVMDIGREIWKEIKNSRAGKSRQKGNENEQNYHL